ncbi:MAG: PAS domain S-box protein [Thermodesulfobacteriota bacterium]|nr:PAS domain S-box protein [Thermodesulfobacteriota bacterium]
METFNLYNYEDERIVIGRLMTAHNLLHIFSSETEMAEFIVEVIQWIPEIDSCGMCTHNISEPFGDLKTKQCETCVLFRKRPDEVSPNDCILTSHDRIRVFPMEISDRVYGFLFLTINDTAKFAPFELFLQSFATSIAIAMENKWQKERLETVNEELFKHREHLEDLVKERTEKLVASNVSLQQEIADRKQAEKALQESEERYRNLVETSPDVIFGLSAEDVTISSLNPAFEKIAGWSDKEFIGENFSSIIHPDNLSLAMEKYQQVLNGKATSTFELKVFSKSGDIIVGEFIAVPEVQNGKVIGVLGFARDITKRTKTEEALRESEELFRSLSENTPDIIYTLDQNGAFTYINSAFKEILGYEREEVIEKYFIDFSKEEDKREYVCLFKRVRDGKETIRDFSGNLMHKDGSPRLFNACASPNFDSEGRLRGMVGLLKDITEHRRLEAQFQQAQKMEAIGTLAGGIAHDFNNLLMGIQGNVSLMLLDIDEDHPHYEKLTSIEQSIRSGANLTKQLLGFARGGKYEVNSIDLNELIRKTSYMFGRTKKEIQIYCNYQSHIWPIEADQGQIEQVLLNLYVNAWQAMPGGGELYIETENIDLSEEFARPYQVEPGRYVKVCISDTGIGMDEETQQRMFDPFFTTKEKGRGTGLGLASVYGIIKNHSGLIEVSSQKGEGTSFIIYLPASERVFLNDVTIFHEDIMRGDETVLLVDDEEFIIDVGEKMLKKMGYTVLTARNGKEAINLCEKNREDIDIVILDIIMPDMRGEVTYERLREINPDIAILLSSGYDVDEQATEIIDRESACFIQKPFNIKQLSQSIREILDKR